jgi:hypothetical protein
MISKQLDDFVLILFGFDANKYKAFTGIKKPAFGQVFL